MNDEKQDDGFEYQGVFYRWSVSDGAKDMLLIDRFTGLPIHEFFEQIEDGFDRSRAPIMLATIATSIRARYPEWSVERIARLVLGLSLSEVTFVGGDEDDEAAEVAEEGPPAAGGQPDPPAGTSTSQSGESKPSVTLVASSLSETSAGTLG